MALAPGSQLGGYEIRRQLGAGGMGVVYLAHDVKLGRQVAIKVLSGDFGADHARTRRFEQEARAASALSHPNVCVVHALGETDGGQPFIAMEYVEGRTLRAGLQVQPPTLRQAIDITTQVASGVGAAHALGIVHRDLKPENVIVRDDGLVKVLDFGLAKLVAGGLQADVPEETRTLVQTDAGVVMGTFTYMAPEQARGLEVDVRADIWALGVILYEMVAGRAPFTGDTRSDVLAAILEREPPALDRLDPRVPHELQRIVAKALRKDRTQRYQTITDFRLDLEALRSELQSSSDTAGTSLPALAVTPPPVRRESSAEYIVGAIGRHKATVGLSVIGVALGVAVIAWSLRSGRPVSAGQPRPGPDAPAPTLRNLTRVTFGDGLQTDSTFSPDGRFIAYASDRAGNFDIWVQPVAGGDPVQVTRSSAQDTQPDWSPDGSTIAFRSERDGGGVFLVPALGGAERRLTGFGAHPKWTADGASLTFLTGSSLDSGEAPAQLYVVDADGRGSPQPLAAPFLTKGQWRWIALHPDGRVSVAGNHQTLGPGFYTCDRRGEQVIKSKEREGIELVDWNGPQRVRFHWNAAGTLLYLETSVNSVESLWRVHTDPRSLDWVSADRLTTGGASDVAAAISRDGTRLAYTQRNVTTRLWSFPLDSNAGRLLGSGEPVTASMAQVSSLSADGDSLAYTLVTPGARVPELRVKHLASGKEEVIAPEGAAPVWSPDGRRLAFLQLHDQEGALMVHDFVHAEQHALSTFSAKLWLIPTSWTRDGQSILVMKSTSDIVPLWQWPATGMPDRPERAVLSKPGVNIWQASLSPNGRWLVFVPGVVAEPDHVRISVVPFEGSDTARWTDIPSESPWVDKPRWSPDGRMLYFIARGSGGFFNLAGVRFDPDKGVALGSPLLLTHFDSPALTISDDLAHTEMGIAAHRAVLTMVTQSGSVWMLDNVDK